MDRRNAGIDLFFQIAPVDDTTRTRLFQLLADHDLETRDIMTVSREQGLNGTQMTQLRLAAAGRLRQDMLAVLGPERGDQFMALRGATRFVPLAEDFAARCAAQGEPLSPPALGAVVINFSRNLQEPGSPALAVLMPSGVPVLDEVAFRSAQKVLTPVQLNLFKRMWAERPFPQTPPGAVLPTR